MHVNFHKAAPQNGWLPQFARVGLAAKGLVYVLVGTIAFMAAFEVGGQTTGDTDKQGVFRFILSQPFGEFLLGVVALGLTCYALWRLLEAWWDTEDRGHDAQGLGRRLGYAFSGLVYGAFAYYAARLALGEPGSGGDARQSLVQELLTKPFGQWLVGAVAIGTMLLGLNQFYRSISGKYRQQIQSGQLPSDLQKPLIRAGYVGYIARGIVWLLIGYLFLRAALAADPREAGGTDEAFALLQHATFGTLLLAVMGLGLVAYGVFMFVRARYGVIKA